MEAEKPTPKKPAPAATEKVPPSEVVLADICKGLKMETRVARRILRAAKMKIEGGRWAWKKGSADVAKVTKLLKDAQTSK